MKKILIVEDTQENLDAAKAYFSTISDFEFLYATNRKEAEELLPISDAVITDRNMPYQDKEDGEDCRDENGYCIALYAKIADKPVVMISEHGALALVVIDKNHEYFSEAVEIAKRFSGRAVHFPESDQLIKAIFKRTTALFNLRFNYDVSKKSSEAWKMAWEKLQKQF